MCWKKLYETETANNIIDEKVFSQLKKPVDDISKAEKNISVEKKLWKVSKLMEKKTETIKNLSKIRRKLNKWNEKIEFHKNKTSWMAIGLSHVLQISLIKENNELNEKKKILAFVDEIDCKGDIDKLKITVIMLMFVKKNNKIILFRIQMHAITI